MTIINLNIEKIINPIPSKWKIIKDYVNSHESFTRKDMRKVMDNFGHSEDQYILIMTNVGFLEKPKTATYIRLAKIPENMSISKLTKLAYDSDYKEEKQKLLTIIKRKEKLNKIKNSSLD